MADFGLLTQSLWASIASSGLHVSEDDCQESELERSKTIMAGGCEGGEGLGSTVILGIGKMGLLGLPIEAPGLWDEVAPPRC